MYDVAIARALHVVSVVLWIGGVGFVTTVLLPAVRSLSAPEERTILFHQIERRFAAQSRISTAVAGVTGFYMIYRFDLWSRFAYGAYWWMSAMVAVWLLFTLMLFVAEPLILHRWLLERSRTKSQATFRLVEWGHRFLLFLALITAFGAVAGNHGLLLPLK
jgi:uncharacterized membrane protein